MQKKLIALFTFFLCLLPLTSWGGYFDHKLKWNTVKTDHFNIHFHNDTEIVAKRVAEICEKLYSEMTVKYDWKPWGRTEIVITDTTDISNAHAITLPYNYIVLFISPPLGDSTLNNFEDWLTDLLRHEYTHILHIDKYGGIAKPFRWVFGKIISPNGLTPGWVREGLAVLEESENGRGRNNGSFSDMMLRTDILNNQFLHLDEMAGVGIDWPAANAAYIYGGAFWQYLKDTYGPEKVQEFIRRYGDSIWLFSLNNKARKVYDNKNFFKLHKEWKQSLEQKYAKQKEEIEAKGLTALQDFQHVDGNLLAATLSPDGSFILYCKNDLKGKPEIRKINIDGSGDEVVHKGKSTTQFSFYPDGSKVVFSFVVPNKDRQVFSDLYELDLKTKKVKGITSRLRANHPTVAPDGKSIIYVSNKNASSQLYRWDIEAKKSTQLTHVPLFGQLSNPRFSPDGKSIAVSMESKGKRDIYLFSADGTRAEAITNDLAIDNHPYFSADGQYVYFTSDRSGVNNIYRVKLNGSRVPGSSPGQARSGMTKKPGMTKEHKFEQITNVLTGVFEPVPTSQGLVVKHYYGRGYDLKKTPLEEASPGLTGGSIPVKGSGPALTMAESQPDESYSLEDLKSDLHDGVTVKKYTPFTKLFVPRYVLPGIAFFDSTLLASATIGSNDPLLWHNWSLGVNYRTDAKHVGFNAFYSYARFDPILYLGYQDYAVSYGDLYGIGSEFFETRRRGYAGFTYPMINQNVSAYYFFEDRSSGSTIPSNAIRFPSLGKFSGFGINYVLNKTVGYAKKISPEWGPRVKLSFEVTDSIFGSSQGNEQIIVSGDAREYIPMPYNKDHYLALRLAGGYAWGDRLLQGTFRLGSALGESPLTGTYSRLFQLRGLPEVTFSGERALLLSGEYRIPLVDPQRGLGTGPIHLNQGHLALFADWGSVWNSNFSLDNFLLGVGLELRGDFVLGYGLPITGRLGYGIIVDGREFIGRFTDPLTGANIKNGALILELGTSF